MVLRHLQPTAPALQAADSRGPQALFLLLATCRAEVFLEVEMGGLFPCATYHSPNTICHFRADRLLRLESLLPGSVCQDAVLSKNAGHEPVAWCGEGGLLNPFSLPPQQRHRLIISLTNEMLCLLSASRVETIRAVLPAGGWQTFCTNLDARYFQLVGSLLPPPNLPY